MTKTMKPSETQTCYYCESAPAAGMKTEIERSWSEEGGGHEVRTRVERPICGDDCEGGYFDGTEDHPGFQRF